MIFLFILLSILELIRALASPYVVMDGAVVVLCGAEVERCGATVVWCWAPVVWRGLGWG